MKRIVGALMFSLVAAGGALAADLPPAPPPQAPAMYVPVAAPMYNWGGIYVGINGGYGWGSVKYTTPTLVGPGGAINGISGTANDNGGVVGGTRRRRGPIVPSLLRAGRVRRSRSERGSGRATRPGRNSEGAVRGGGRAAVARGDR